MPQPKTNADFLDKRFQELLSRNEQIGEFELRRLEADVRKNPDEYQKSLDMAYISALWGRYEEASRWIFSTGGYSPSTALRYAGAAQAALQFHKTREALRYALDSGQVNTYAERRYVFVTAGFSCSFEICKELISVLDQEEDSGQVRAIGRVVSRVDSLGLKDEHVQAYVMRALAAANPWLRDQRRSMEIEHLAYPEMPNKILVRVGIPADPDEFGEIMWAMSDIDRSGIPPEVSESVIISAMPVE